MEPTAPTLWRGRRGCRGCPLRVLRGWLPPAQPHVVDRTGRASDVPSITSARRAVAIGRAARSQPRTNLLLGAIAKSLRPRHLPSRILPARSVWLTATAAAYHPLGGQPRPPSNGPLRANMRRSGHIGAKFDVGLAPVGCGDRRAVYFNTC